ncbi:carbohydrate ABC transporter permease [Clostridium estertheticum]|uniref:ABC transporter permease n=1 Tax=Clostridium estertheticum subsp. estertheticum TaxID=1552 RepID=A0A1J0GDT1_9CLOT|nr:sugar ABC transporter permease [Clostridium estertheticum]APC39513.1 ABC transporter permease [Clostridium estertheticum subsp. estertheticum]MBU3072193.1 sugar ABC transporter permease [Clostridium estertheticum]MBU3162285.1 sugar ABC transporter permease [Clostridium estertheticum]MBU3170716.1 sugar ABC transporter permease [Clostridium estertheticum]MBU3184653.1 sugar ABC transporter permease [Clostridium estertheticum]
MSKKKKSLKFGNNNVTGYILIAPWLIGFLIMYAIPMVISLYFSFTKYNLLSAPRFIGIDNFKRMFFNDPSFWKSLGVTFYYVFMLVPLRLIFAFIVAMLLNSKRKFLGLYRAVYYVPSIVGGSVAVSIVWKQIFGNDGVAMALLSIIGIHQKISFIGNPSTAIWTIISLGVWQFGSAMLIFLAAIKQLPKSIYESASIDGAGFFRQVFKITIPMLTPVIFFNLILQIINAFKAFTESYIITQGGPMDSTLFYVLNLYRKSFTYFDMGYSSAMAWVLVAIIGIFTAVLFKSQTAWVHYESKE